MVVPDHIGRVIFVPVVLDEDSGLCVSVAGGVEGPPGSNVYRREDHTFVASRYLPDQHQHHQYYSDACLVTLAGTMSQRRQVGEVCSTTVSMAYVGAGKLPV